MPKLYRLTLLLLRRSLRAAAAAAAAVEVEEEVGGYTPAFPASSASPPAPAPEVTDDTVLATLAECARRLLSSRVSLFTTASCSFSSSRCSSAAVRGRGCRMGACAASAPLERPGERGGKACMWEACEAGSVPPGDASGRGGGLMWWTCEARRDAGVDGWRVLLWEGALVRPGRGDTGTEFRSGAMVAGVRGSGVQRGWLGGASCR